MSPGGPAGRMVLAVAGLLFFAGPLAAQVLVGIAPSGVAAAQGGQGLVPIVIDLTSAGGATLGAYRLQLDWDPAVIQYVRTTPGAFSAPSVNAATSAAGHLVLAGANPTGGAGSMVVANVTFQMVADTGSSALTLTADELTAAGSYSDLLPGSSAIPGRFCANTGVYGDVNRNGSILSDDALIVLTAAVGLPIGSNTLVNADVDNDGKRDTRDALIILSQAAGLATTGFRVGETNTGSCSVVAVSSLTLTPGTAQLAAGDVLQLTLAALDAGGQPVAAPTVAWFSGTPATATVDAGGRVTAIGAGSVTISASALGGLSTTTTITVTARHTWFVAQSAAGAATQLGSSAFPFSRIQQALDAAVPGDTVRVALGTYAGAIITKPVVLLGDSSASGMPRIHNSSGAAINSNTTGRVVLRKLELTESNVGLLARGDTVEAQSIRATTLRGPGFRIRKMRRATLNGVSAESVTLAGILVDSTGVLVVNGADVRLVGLAGDTSAGVAVLDGDTALVSGLTVFGVDRGVGALFQRLTRAVLDGFDIAHTFGLDVDSVRSVAILDGTVYGVDEESPAFNVKADTAVVDTVLIRLVRSGMRFRPTQDDALTHSATTVTVTRSVVDTVRFGPGMSFERLGSVRVSRGLIAAIGEGNGLEARQVDTVRVDSTTVKNVPFGIGVYVDSTAAVLAMRGGRVSNAFEGGIQTDSVRTVSLVGVEVDSSAVPVGYTAVKFAIRANHADSVRLDSLNVHDNIGGGILVDSARVVTATGGLVANNLGFGGECDCGPPAVLPSHPSYSSNTGAGMVLAAVEDARIAHYGFENNSEGGLTIDYGQLLGRTTVDTSSFTNSGSTRAIWASSGGGEPGGELNVRRSTFFQVGQAVYATYLRRLLVETSTLDSLYNYYDAVVEAYGVDTVLVRDDTLRTAYGWGFRLSYADLVDARRNLISGVHAYYPDYYQEAALEAQDVDSVVIYGNRVEANTVRGIIVRGSGSLVAAIDSNVVADDTAFAGIQVHRPATVTRNLITRNTNGIYVADDGGTSVINNNNIEGNVTYGLWNETATAVDAQSNWWNDAVGPRCAGLVTGCTSTTGDVAYGSSGTVNYTGFLAARATGAPTATPPVSTTAAGREGSP